MLETFVASLRDHLRHKEGIKTRQEDRMKENLRLLEKKSEGIEEL